MLTDFHNIWHIVYWVNVQHNLHLFAHLTHILLLHYFGKHCSSKGLTGQSCTWMHKNWRLLCQDARASFLSILALRLMTVIIITSYWCSRCCSPFVPLLVMLTYSSKTLHQRSVCVCARLMAELLQSETPKFIAPDSWPPNSPDLNPEYEMLCRIVFIRC